MASESSIEEKCRLHVESLGGRMPKWTSPGNLGVQDRILLIQGLPVIFVEFKRSRGGRYSPSQDDWHDWMGRKGFERWRIDSVEEFKTKLGELHDRNGEDTPGAEGTDGLHR